MPARRYDVQLDFVHIDIELMTRNLNVQAAMYYLLLHTTLITKFKAIFRRFLNRFQSFNRYFRNFRGRSEDVSIIDQHLARLTILLFTVKNRFQYITRAKI